jgi:response regulator RpfG family c-di-GMP phosphodiesterase
MLSERLGLPATVNGLFPYMTERWDGKGVPGAAAGEEICRPVRIVRVIHDFVAIAQARDRAAAVEALKRRRGRGYGPVVVDAVLVEPGALLRAAEVPDAWERVIDASTSATRA